MTEREPASYRDPLGHILYDGKRVIRRLSPDGQKLFDPFYKSPLFSELSESRRIVATRLLDTGEFADADFPAALEHERVPFISYPFEWPFAMLKDAALLTLDIMCDALKHGFVLRDGSSMNVQFAEGRAVFIDLLSFAPYREGDIWNGYSQFCRMFLFPLMLSAHRRADYRHWLKGSIDGISLDDMAGIFSWADSFKSGVLFQVLLQNRLAKKTGDAGHAATPANMNAHKLGLIAQQLRSATASLYSPFRGTEWAGYADACHYSDTERSAKAAFVDGICGARGRGLVWDIGTNTGEYAMIAAKHARLVVAIDADHGAVERLYRDLEKEEVKNILPLLVDMADPSPSTGWRNAETKTLEERGRPDLVIALALIHHLCIARNVGLASFVDWITGLGDEGIVEFVGKDDPMVRHLLATREDIFHDYTRERFDDLIREKAVVKEVKELRPGMRYLYYYTKR